MESGAAAEATPLQHALDDFSTSLDHLVKLLNDGTLDDLDPNGLVGVLQDIEQIRNRIPLIDHTVITHATGRDLPAALCQRSMNRVLTTSLRISIAEAGRRVRAAEHLTERLTATGEPLPPWRPRLAEAQRGGDITPDQAHIIDTELRKVDGRGFDPAAVDTGEQILVQAATTMGPEDLRSLAVSVIDAIDPDGTLPDDEHQKARRYFHLRAAKDGSFRGEFRLTPDIGQKLKTILDSLSAPRTTTYTLGDNEDPTIDTAADGGMPDGRMAEGRMPVGGMAEGRMAELHAGADGAEPAAQTRRRQTEVDTRTRGQRMHDAIGDICDRLLRSGTLPDTGGTPTTLIIGIDADDLQHRTGHGRYTDGNPISPQTVIDLADQANLAWCLKNSKGTILAFGQTRRLASPSQTLALHARDGGCSFPGCDTEPTWCERHHIVPWIDGGPTNLSNLTLLCRYHHHNFEQHGWTCNITSAGLPAWTPPKWIDRQQRPIIHPRIRIRHGRIPHGRPAELAPLLPDIGPPG